MPNTNSLTNDALTDLIETQTATGTEIPPIEMLYGGYVFIYKTENNNRALFWQEKKDKQTIDHFISAFVEVTAQVRNTDNAGYVQTLQKDYQREIQR